MVSICIIGFGRTGSHLYYALKKTKAVKISGVIKNTRSKYSAALLESSDVIFLCTGDKGITSACSLIIKCKANLKNKIIFHTSGAKTSDELKSLKLQGALTGSFHPVQTFESKAKKYSARFEKIFVAVEGEKIAVKAGFNLARLIKSKPVEIPKAGKVFHHICCVISSNFLVTLLHLAGSTFGKMQSKRILKNGFNKNSFFSIYHPLTEQTLVNISKNGTLRALTGPIERNDIETVKLHLDSIKRAAKDILPLYIFMGIETTKAALQKKSLSSKEALTIIELLNKY